MLVFPSLCNAVCHSLPHSIALTIPTQFSKVVPSMNSRILYLKDLPALTSPTVELTTLPFKSPLCPVHASQVHQVTLLSVIEAMFQAPFCALHTNHLLSYLSVLPMDRESLNNILKLVAFNYTNRCNQRRNTYCCKALQVPTPCVCIHILFSICFCF